MFSSYIIYHRESDRIIEKPNYERCLKQSFVFSGENKQSEKKNTKQPPRYGTSVARKKRKIHIIFPMGRCNSMYVYKNVLNFFYQNMYEAMC